MQTNVLILTGALFVLVLFLIPGSVRAAQISGTVTDDASRPITGVTVRLESADGLLLESMSDVNGEFLLSIKNTPDRYYSLKLTAVGYRSKTISINPSVGSVDMAVVLAPELVELATVTVHSTPLDAQDHQTIGAAAIVGGSKSGLVSTDPVSAIRKPSVQRIGSAHSSKIRIYGTVPRFHLNSIPIGNDPNHYGVFSFIPAPALSRMDLYTNGSPADFAPPSLIDLSTPARFVQHESGELHLSLIDATSFVSFGSERAFTSITLRKSVLDKLAHRIDHSSSRATIPPTNFQDLMISSGLKLSNQFRLYLDQYHVRDFLAFNTSHLNYRHSFETFQNMQDNYVGLRLDRIGAKSLTRLSASIRFSKEIYRAKPEKTLDGADLYIDLNARRRHWQLAFDQSHDAGNTKYRYGFSIERAAHSKIDLYQQNWNFLPPDAASDRPFVFQTELNDAYGQFHDDRDENRQAAYLSVGNSFGNLSAESGLRFERFGHLSNNPAYLFRQKLRYNFDDRHAVELFAGTFAESPLSRILEPYQILIIDQQELLRPIKTSLLSAAYCYPGARLNLFAKKIDNLPVHSPPFDAVGDSGNLLRFGSEGHISLIGAELSAETEHLLGSQLEAHGYYGYTHAVKANGSTEVDYELNAPHRLYGELIYPLSERWRIGCDLSIRSGLPYSPNGPTSTTSEGGEAESAYESYSANENSLHFPVNYALNLHSRYQVGRTELFLNVANITNRANPIISTANGYVYDTGLMPSFGLRIKL